jgi:hypothetical protein
MKNHLTNLYNQFKKYDKKMKMLYFIIKEAVIMKLINFKALKIVLNIKNII